MSTTLSTKQKQPKTLKKRDTGFLIEWKDGHVSQYPYPYLRQMCPCAECSMTRHGGHDVHSLFSPQGDGDPTKIAVSNNIQPLDIQLVGRYALQFKWNDGHSSGIYPFETLREICPSTGDNTMNSLNFQPEKHEISVQQLKQKFDNDEQILLIDVREPHEHEFVHIQGAQLIPLNELPQHVDELDKNAEIVLHCHHGMRSMQATAYLHQSGFSNVKNLTGGIDQWAIEIDPTLNRY